MDGMSGVDPFVPSLTQDVPWLWKRREEKSAEEHLGMWMESELGILSSGAQPRSTPKNSRVLAGSRVYQPTWEKSCPILARVTRELFKWQLQSKECRKAPPTPPINPENHKDRAQHKSIS